MQEHHSPTDRLIAEIAVMKVVAQMREEERQREPTPIYDAMINDMHADYGPWWL